MSHLAIAGFRLGRQRIAWRFKAFLLTCICSVFACDASHLQRIDMLALTDFQQASHRLQESSSRLLARNHSIPGDEFGSALTSLGDIDGDGNMEIAVGASYSKLGCGSVHILSIKPDSDAELLASHVLLPNSTTERCASALGLIGYTWIGPMLQERHTMLGVGAPTYGSKGAVLVSILNKRGSTVGPMTILQPPSLTNHSLFGSSLTYAGDIDGDGNTDLLIGAPGENSVYLALLNKIAKPYSFSKTGSSSSRDEGFGSSVASLGDVDNDGRMEVLVASNQAVHLLYLASGGFSEKSVRLKLPRLTTKYLAKGSSLSFVGLDDNDDVVFAIGSRYANDGGLEKGAVWIVTMNPDGHVKNWDKLSETQGPFTARLDEREHFGASLAPVLDTNKDGFAELLIGAPRPSSRVRTNNSNSELRNYRRGGIWIADIPGTRAKKVTMFGLADSAEDCVYDNHTCTCSYRSGLRSTCLALATIDQNGGHCHARSCADAFVCGKFPRTELM